MTQHVRTAYRKHRKVTFAGVLAVLVAVVLVVMVVPAGAADGGAPSGLGVAPTTVTLGGQGGDCAAVGSTASREFRIVNPQTGPYTDAATGATFTLTVAAGQLSLSFTSTGASVADIVIKGGTKSSHYDYFAAGIGSVTADTALHAPPKGSSYFSVSHVAFCYSAGGGIPLSCGGTATGSNYVVTLGSGANCNKSPNTSFIFETWSDGGNQYAKFVPAGPTGAGEKALLVEKISWTFTGTSQNSSSLKYDDDASNGINYVPMPFCNFDPRTGDTGLVLDDPTNAAAVLPTGATSCLIESTEKVGATSGQASTRTDYVFSSVDGFRLIP
jgi:hypothetical protein